MEADTPAQPQQVHQGLRSLPALRQVWRVRWLLFGLFIIDWIIVSLDHAALVTLRIGMLTSTFILLFATTSIPEFKSALEWFGIPGRYAFSISLAFQSLGSLEREWQAIKEAQIVRGAWVQPEKWALVPQNVDTPRIPAE